MSDHFVKRRGDAPPGLFAAEAAGLGWLRVDGGAPVVKVVGWTPTSITLERLIPVPATKLAAENCIFAAYETASSNLPDGWRSLIGLHQVYPLLVHTVLFGGGYAGQAVHAARAYL